MSKLLRNNRSDGDQTRVCILETAGSLFAEHGFAETTNKAIAQQANLDLALINYHFGNRNGLYQATLLEAHKRILRIEDLERVVNSTQPTTEKLASLIDALVSAASAPQNWPLRVLAREVLAPTSHIQVLIEKEAQPKATLIKVLLSELTGIDADDPRLVVCMVNIIAPCLMLILAKPTILPAISPSFNQMPRARLVTALKTFIFAGLEAVIAEDSLND